MESGCVTFLATTALELLRFTGLYSSRGPGGQGLNLFDRVQEGLWFRSPGTLIPVTEKHMTREGADGRQLYDQVVV